MSLAKTYRCLCRERNCAPLNSVTCIIRNNTQHDNLETTFYFIYTTKLGKSEIFEVLKVVAKKVSFFCDVMPHRLVEVYQCFGRNFCPHYQCV
jgi:hypothetical protein